MDALQLLDDAFARVPTVVRSAVEDLDDAALHWRPSAEANPIGWLVWHLAREQDAQVTPLTGIEPVWTAGGWDQRFGLPEGANDHGYGWTSAQVDALRLPPTDELLDHLDAVSACCRQVLEGLTEADLDVVLDHSWDPPVTVGARLVSVVDDAAQHAGQVGYVRGLLDTSR